jgi:hypothetical protein
MCPDESPPESPAEDEAADEPDEPGQVSEVSGMEKAPDPIASEDATAGYPTSESGHPDEGTAGPNAAPVHDPPEPENRSSR